RPTCGDIQSLGPYPVGVAVMDRDARGAAPGGGLEMSPEQLALAIIDSSDDAIFAKALDGTILSWNRAAARMYQYRAEEIIGRDLSVLVPSYLADETGVLLARLGAGEHVG